MSSGAARPQQKSNLNRRPVSDGPSAVSRAKTDGRTEWAMDRARDDLRRLTVQIARAEEQLEQRRQDRLKAFDWVETTEERALRTRIELLRARKRSVGKWLEGKSPKTAREAGNQPRQATKNRQKKRKSGQKAAKPKAGKPKGHVKPGSAEPQKPKPAKAKKGSKKAASKRKSKQSRRGSVLNQVSGRNGVRRVTLIG